MKINERENLVYQILIACILISHTFIFNNIPLQFDELLMFEIVSKPFSEMMNFLMTAELQMPLLYLLTKAMIVFFGDSSFILRMPSLIFLLILPFAFYKLARFTLNKPDSLKAVCLLLMAHPIYIYSGSMRPYLVLVLFTILVLGDFLGYVKNRVEFKRSTFLKTGFYLLILSLIHPIGICLSGFFLGLLLRKIPKNRKYFNYYIFFCVLSSSIVFYYRFKDFLYITQNKADIARLLIFLQQSTFLTSGLIFSLIFLTLTICSIFGFFRNQKINFYNIDKFHLVICLISFISGAILSILLKQYIYPRLLLFCLPSLTIVTIQFINLNIIKSVLRNSIFILLLLSLTYKTFLKENLQSKPYEIESFNISQKALNLSANKIKIISCGNCLSYYIKSNKLHCVASFPESFNLIKNDKEIIIVEFNFSANLCHNKYPKNTFERLDNTSFIGGNVFRARLLDNGKGASLIQ